MEKLSDLNPAKFTVLSLNIQSLPAKYVEFSELINDFSSPDLFPDVICLQETWKIVDNHMFSLPNYHALEINQRQMARGGRGRNLRKKTPVLQNFKAIFGFLRTHF